MRADVETLAVGRDGGGVDDLVLGVGRELGGGQHVDRQDQFDAALLGLGEEALHLVELVGLQQRLADLVALGLEEGVRHAAADEQPVDLGQQVRDDAELVGHLRAAEHDHVGPLHVVGQLLQHVQLGQHQATGVRREHRRDLVDRGLLAVDHTEAVGDERAARDERAQLGGQLGAVHGVLAGLARVEAHVLQQDDAAVGQAAGQRLRGLADQVTGQRDLGAEQLGKPLGDGREGVLRVRLALGAAEVRGDDDLRARVGELLDRRQRGADPAVVGDAVPVERDVQVAAHQHVAALNALAQQVVEVLDGHPAQSFEPTSLIRSARRLE